MAILGLMNGRIDRWLQMNWLSLRNDWLTDWLAVQFLVVYSSLYLTKKTSYVIKRLMCFIKTTNKQTKPIEVQEFMVIATYLREFMEYIIY